MTIPPHVSMTRVLSTPSLVAFQEAALQGEHVCVSHDGEQWRVFGEGTTPTQRRVAWVQPQNQPPAAISAFVDALNSRFSAKVVTTVAHELGLASDQGAPLSSRAVQKAMDMASASQQMLTGVDFVTQLMHSATKGGRDFAMTVQDMGVDAGLLTSGIRQMIDDHMAARFQYAQAQGQSPISAQVAKRWLQEELSRCL